MNYDQFEAIFNNRKVQLKNLCGDLAEINRRQITEDQYRKVEYISGVDIPTQGIR